MLPEDGSECPVSLSGTELVGVAGDAGFDLAEYPAVVEWIDRIRALPGYMHDFVPYPENALPGRGRSIYE